nr:hypothetical protein [Tanacetum cinerariifolium]
MQHKHTITITPSLVATPRYTKFQDTANSEQKKETKAMVFYQMDTEEVSDRFMAPCFVHGLKAYDGEINLGVKENMILNEYAVILCLEHEMKRGNKMVKKELIVALRGEFHFVKFIINPEEDDVEPGVILGRSFLRMTKAITNFGAATVTIYPEIDPFLEDIEEEEKSLDDWDHLLDFNLDDVQLLGTSSSAGGHLTQEEAVKQALAIRMSRKFTLLDEERPIIETMIYHDKYKKILDEIWKDKVELDGKIIKEEEEAVKRIKGREEIKKVDREITMINLTQAEAIGILTNVLCQVGVTTLIAKFVILDIPIDRDVPIVVGQGFLRTIGGIVNILERLFSNFDGFCHQTFRAARYDVTRNTDCDSDDEEEYQIKRNKFGAPIYGPKPVPYLNCNDPAERSTHDDEAKSLRSKCSRQNEIVEEELLPQVHHEFLLWEGCSRDAKSRIGCDGEIDDMLRIRLREARSNKEIFTSVAWIKAFNINEPIYAELCHEFYSTYKFDKAVELDEEGFNVYFEGGDTFTIRNPILRVIHKMITYGLCQRMTWYDKIQKNDLWLLSTFDARYQNGYANVAWLIARWMKRKRAGAQKERQIYCGQFISKIARKSRVLIEDVARSLSALIYCRDLDTIKDLIDSEGKLIPEDPQQRVPRVGILRPSRASMQDLYDRICRIEIRQEAIDRMEYRQSYHWDRYQGVFENMAGVYIVILQGAYNPPGYAQP